MDIPLVHLYKLDGKTPVPVEDTIEWAMWHETANRHVALDRPAEGVKVSTVFLGLDHSFLENGPPILFETMVFGGILDGEMDRYSTWDEAVAGHAAMVKRVLIEEP